MSEVIDRIKDKYPQYRDVPDDQLTVAIANKYPQYLDKDPKFKDDYHRNVANGIALSLGMAGQDISQLAGVLTNPAAGAAAAEGREQVAADQQPQTQDSLRPMTAYERFRFGPVGQALMGKTAIEREHFRNGMGPIEGLTHEIKLLDLKPKDIVEAARQFSASAAGTDDADALAPEPTDKSVDTAMKASKPLALEIGAVQGGQSLYNFFTSPLGVATIGIGALPRTAQRLIALGFSAQMAAQVPEIATQLGDEMGKPEDQRDYKTIGNLVTQAITTTGFSVMGVLHAAAPGKAPVKTDTPEAPIKDQQIAAAGAPATAAETVEDQNAIQSKSASVLRTVQDKPGESQGEVSTAKGGGETGARGSDEAQPQKVKTEAQQDRERYDALMQSMRGKSLDEGMQIAGQIEAIKNKYGGMPPPQEELITHAAYIDDEGNTHVGSNHPEILERLGIEEGQEDPDSRNTQQFGFFTNKGRFISREEAGPIATAAGQNLKEFEPGEPVHSNEVADPNGSGEALGDAQSPPVPAGEPPVIQAGAAHITEIPETGAGGEKYGISAQVRAERAQASQVDWIPPGEGVAVDPAIQHGRGLNEADPAAPERFMQAFEADPERKISYDMTSSLRAHGESLAAKARRVEEKFGTESPEYDAAKAELNAWDKRTKPVQTEWHKIGQAQQGWTDLDTGSVAGLERERTRLTGKEFTPDEKKEAAGRAEQVRTAEKETTEAQGKVNEEIRANASPERELETAQGQMTDNMNSATDSRTQIKAAQDAIDAANKVVRETAVRGADEETKARVEQAKRDRDTAKVQKKAAEDALKAAQKAVRDSAQRVAKAETKVRARAVLDEQAKAARRAQDAVWKTLREAAVRTADAENKARTAQTVRDKAVYDVQAKAAKRAEDAVWKQARDAARRTAAAERKLVGDGSIAVWNKARAYLERPFFPMEGTGTRAPDLMSFDDLRNKIATDLGMSTERVTRLLGRKGRMKYLTDDLWVKRQRERNVKTKARLWVEGLDMPAYEKFIHSLPRALFKIRVGFHGTVALGTHAPAVAFDPRFWGSYVRNFGKMYHMVGSPEFFEGQMQDLMRRKNYATAVRSGLIVDPFKHEDFSHPGFSTEATDKVKAAYAKATGLNPEWFTKMGERGYSVLKTLRMDMFDQHWNALPRQLQTTEMAEAISDAVNHITGVVQTPAPFKAELVAFAPKLQMSRAAFLFGDPARALRTGVRSAIRATGEIAGYKGKLPQVTPAEQYFAINELKSKAVMLGTLGSLLALNQGILAMSGSKQSVNLTDPFKSDFGKFKVAGLNVSYGNPLITMLRLPIRIGSLAAGPGGKLRGVIYPDETAATMAWEYFRSQLSPFAALAADMVFREDWQRRQLWFSERPEPRRLAAQGIEPYTPQEYWTQQALPIPFQELMRETWQTGWGLSPEQLKSSLKALGSTAFMGATGGRVSTDYEMEKSQ